MHFYFFSTKGTPKTWSFANQKCSIRRSDSDKPICKKMFDGGNKWETLYFLLLTNKTVSKATPPFSAHRHSATMLWGNEGWFIVYLANCRRRRFSFSRPHCWLLFKTTECNKLTFFRETFAYCLRWQRGHFRQWLSIRALCTFYKRGCVGIWKGTLVCTSSMCAIGGITMSSTMNCMCKS